MVWPLVNIYGLASFCEARQVLAHLVTDVLNLNILKLI